jgi:GH24 family phage-related lysozyme (muramidase)
MAQALSDIQVLLLAILALAQLVVFGVLHWRALGLVAKGQGLAPVPVAAQPAHQPVALPAPPVAPPAPAAPVSPSVVIDQALINAVKKFEGFSAKAYGDFKQYSIGYGTKATSPDEVITEAEAEKRLLVELGHAQQAVEKFAPEAPIGAKQALTDLTYNSGTAWESAGLGQLVKSGDWAGAKARILQYNHAGGDVNAGLTARREAEASWFDHPL